MTASILTVDDSPSIRVAIKIALTNAGYTVTEAANGAEGIEKAQAAAFDMIITDLNMPVMDGLTAARAIRADERWKKLPIVMLTAKAMPDDQQKCIDAGANDHMSKPIDVDKLLSLVRVWMPR